MQSSLHNTSLPRSAFPSLLTTTQPASPKASPTLDTLIGDAPTAGGFAALLTAYRSTGGTAPVHERKPKWRHRPETAIHLRDASCSTLS